EKFATEVLPRTLGPMLARLNGKQERMRSRSSSLPRRWWRAFFVTGSLAIGAAAVILISRPRPTQGNGYSGIKGQASAPIGIIIKRGTEIFPLAPGEKLKPGDGVRFIVRLTRPRYLELRARGPAGGPAEVTLFPAGARAQLVQPGETLPGGFVVDAAPG